MLYSIENFRYVMPFVHTCCTSFTLKVRDKEEREIVRVKRKSPLGMKTVLNKLDKKFVKKNSHLIIYLKNDDSLKSAIYNIYFSCQFFCCPCPIVHYSLYYRGHYIFIYEVSRQGIIISA